MNYLQIYRQWQAEAAAYRGPDMAGARRGMDDCIWAECLLLAEMLERGEITMDELVQESKSA